MHDWCVSNLRSGATIPDDDACVMSPGDKSIAQRREFQSPHRAGVRRYGLAYALAGRHTPDAHSTIIARCCHCLAVGADGQSEERTCLAAGETVKYGAGADIEDANEPVFTDRNNRLPISAECIVRCAGVVDAERPPALCA